MKTQKQMMIRFLHQMQGLGYTEAIAKDFKSSLLGNLQEVADYLEGSAPVPAGIAPFLADLEEGYGDTETFESTIREIRRQIVAAQEQNVENTLVWETLKEADEQIRALAGHLATARAFLQELLESKNR